MATGRPIISDDARTMGANAVAVLSYGFWQQRFGGDPGILNQQLSDQRASTHCGRRGGARVRWRRDGRSARDVHSCHHEARN